jgi:hypothetical protein
MNEFNKDELLDLEKWQRFFFMVVYGSAMYFVVGALALLVCIQFLFYLFTSKVNAQLQAANNWLQEFFNDSLNFLSFNTNSKPWPFNDKGEASDAEEEVETVEVVEGESEEVELDVEQSEQPNS